MPRTHPYNLLVFVVFKRDCVRIPLTVRIVVSTSEHKPWQPQVLCSSQTGVHSPFWGAAWSCARPTPGSSVSFLLHLFFHIIHPHFAITFIILLPPLQFQLYIYYFFKLNISHHIQPLVCISNMKDLFVLLVKNTSGKTKLEFAGSHGLYGFKSD